MNGLQRSILLNVWSLHVIKAVVLCCVVSYCWREIVRNGREGAIWLCALAFSTRRRGTHNGYWGNSPTTLLTIADNCSVYVKEQVDQVEVFLEMSASGEVFLGPGPAGSRLSVQGHGVQ